MCRALSETQDLANRSGEVNDFVPTVVDPATRHVSSGGFDA